MSLVSVDECANHMYGIVFGHSGYTSKLCAHEHVILQKLHVTYIHDVSTKLVLLLTKSAVFGLMP